jgi:rSAM/selenodomain-associated transferase 1
MAKAPLAGQVKTRLCPPLSPEEAAELYRCFLLDKIQQVRSLDNASPVIAYTPTDSGHLFEGLAPGFSLLPQRGVDLGARLASSLDHLLALGNGGALAIDSDTPTLPVPLLQSAVDLLAGQQVDVVVGPSEDGGYYLIGLRASQPELFAEMPWSTSGVLRETTARARARGLRLAELPPWYDVDTPGDLERLRADLAGPQRGGASRTRGFLQASGR